MWLRFGPYFSEPVVAGLDENGAPYITAMDLLGAPVDAADFVVSGTCTENLYGMCESLYRENMVRSMDVYRCSRLQRLSAVADVPVVVVTAVVDMLTAIAPTTGT